MLVTTPEEASNEWESLVKQGHPLLKEFLTAMDNDPSIENYGVKFSQEAKQAGHDLIGIDVIRGRIRWESFFYHDREFKFPNGWSPLFARFLMAKHPDLVGLFELRQLNLAGRIN